MTLPTLSKLPIAPPLTNAVSRRISTDPAKGQTAHDSVGMAQVMAWNYLHIRGIGAEAVLSGAYHTPQMAIGSVTTVPDGILARLRRDEFLLLTADLKAAMDHLASKPAGTLITLTDITHGRAVIYLGGTRAPDVLPKVCGLDFADTKFPNLHAAQTSLAKVRTLIIRMDTGPTPAYLLVVDRSLADYVWEVIDDAAQEWGVTVMSQDSLELPRK